MKKIIPFIFSSILGGCVAYGLFTFSASKQSLTPLIQQVPNHFESAKATQTSALSAEMSVDFTNAAEATVNGVVHVKTKFTNSAVGYGLDPIMEYFFGMPSPQQKGAPAVGAGSGVIISEDGYIVTNNHVIDKAEQIEVVLNDNRSFDAKLIGRDPSTDLALLKIEGTQLPFVPYGNSERVKTGEWVLAVGNPFNLTSTVTAGIVSAKGRNINILNQDPENNGTAIESFIQTDAAVNPGNSGGALVNTKGELIGINAAIKSNTGSYAGYSFAIPVDIVKKVVDDLLEFGMVQRAFIGVSIRNVDAALAKEEGLDEIKGVFIAGLTDDGAAGEAGIQQGDVINKINNHAIKDIPELQEQLGEYRPGDRIIVSVKRKGAEKELPVVLKNKFGKAEIVKKNEVEVESALGAVIEPVDVNELKKLRITNGVKVTKLTNGKLKSSGIKEGFIITSVDNKRINSNEDLINVLNGKKGGVLIEGVYSNGMRAYYGFGM